jgi:hypothetical protein
MTVEELRDVLNITYGINKEWPRVFEVDAETYANCCQAVFKHVNEETLGGIVHLGVENNGLMLWNVELIYKERIVIRKRVSI